MIRKKVMAVTSCNLMLVCFLNVISSFSSSSLLSHRRLSWRVSISFKYRKNLWIKIVFPSLPLTHWKKGCHNYCDREGKEDGMRRRGGEGGMLHVTSNRSVESDLINAAYALFPLPTDPPNAPMTSLPPPPPQTTLLLLTNPSACSFAACGKVAQP